MQWELFTWVLVLIILFFAFLLLMDERRLRKKNKEIERLRAFFEKEEDQAQSVNRRDFFRVEMSGESCRLEVLDAGDPTLDAIKNKRGEAQLLDISVTGAKINCRYDLPVRKKVLVQLHVTLREETFSFKGVLLRKEQQLDQSRVVYGIEYVDPDREDQKRLNVILNRIKIERHKTVNPR